MQEQIIISTCTSSELRVLLFAEMQILWDLTSFSVSFHVFINLLVAIVYILKIVWEIYQFFQKKD